MAQGMKLSVIIPAHDEAAWIGPCLDALFAQTGAPSPREIVVVANGCADDTAALARARTEEAAAAGWRLSVLELSEGGKPGALNAGDAAAAAPIRAYLDADVTCSPPLMGQLHAALDTPEPRYASGRLQVAPAKTWTTHRYADLWTRLPFMTEGVPGAGLFAVNAAGRARWDAWPQIISDDTFARVQFAPEERIGVEADYLWPMVEGWRNLVRVRARQNAGVREIAERWPELMANEGKAGMGLSGAASLLTRTPASFAVYAAISAAVAVAERLRGGRAWTRGR
ncbi:MAG: glycosyltransferase family 2 protein [Pseudomonadota bacterium]